MAYEFITIKIRKDDWERLRTIRNMLEEADDHTERLGIAAAISHILDQREGKRTRVG